MCAGLRGMYSRPSAVTVNALWPAAPLFSPLIYAIQRSHVLLIRAASAPGSGLGLLALSLPGAATTKGNEGE